MRCPHPSLNIRPDTLNWNVQCPPCFSNILEFCAASHPTLNIWPDVPIWNVRCPPPLHSQTSYLVSLAELVSPSVALPAQLVLLIVITFCNIFCFDGSPSPFLVYMFSLKSNLTLKTMSCLHEYKLMSIICKRGGIFTWSATAAMAIASTTVLSVSIARLCEAVTENTGIYTSKSQAEKLWRNWSDEFQFIIPHALKACQICKKQSWIILNE